MMQKFTDIHHHILYGMDDGAQSATDMQAMLRRAAEENIGRIVATPHVTPGVRPFNRERFALALSEARAFCAQEGLDIELFEGAEILYTEMSCRLLEEGQVPTMAGTDCVLVEFSPDVRYDYLRRALTELRRGGYRPIVAHTERYLCLNRRVSRLEELRRELDVYYQVNCGTIIKPRDFFTKHFLHKIVEWDLLDFIATDAHRPARVRTANMREAWKVLAHAYGENYADELTSGEPLFEMDEIE